MREALLPSNPSASAPPLALPLLVLIARQRAKWVHPSGRGGGVEGEGANERRLSLCLWVMIGEEEGEAVCDGSICFSARTCIHASSRSAASPSFLSCHPAT